MTERTNDHENTKDSKAIRDFDSKIKTSAEGIILMMNNNFLMVTYINLAGDVKSDQDQIKCDKKDVKEKQEVSL